MTGAEERALELRVGTIEPAVVPVEAATCFGGRDDERQEDAAEERLVLGRSCTRVRAREDRRGRLAPQLVERDRGVLPFRELRAASVHVRPDERTVLVQRRTAARAVLLEGERDLRAVLDLLGEEAKRPQAEGPEHAIEGRRPHTPRYALGGSSPLWQAGHQYAVRFSSPRPRERISPPQRGHPRPARR